MVREWRVCLVLLVLWWGSRDVVNGGDLESIRPKYLDIVGTGQGENEQCIVAYDPWHPAVARLAGKSADQLVKDRRANFTDGLKGFTDEAVAENVNKLLTILEGRYSKSVRCIVREGLVCRLGKCIKCDKAEAEEQTTCGFIKMIVDKEGSQAPSKKSEGGIKGTSSKESEGGRVKTSVGVVVVSLIVIGFVFAL